MSGRNTVGRPMEILLVEDSRMSATLTAGVLRSWSVPHRLTWLCDGADSWNYLQRCGLYANAPAPDLLLLDLELPGLHGREILTRLRAAKELATIPVLLMTGANDADVQAAVNEFDVAGVLPKPVELAVFLSRLQNIRKTWHDGMLAGMSRPNAATSHG